MIAVTYTYLRDIIDNTFIQLTLGNQSYDKTLFYRTNKPMNRLETGNGSTFLSENGYEVMAVCSISEITAKVNSWLLRTC